MKWKINKKMAVIIAVLILSVSLASTVFAAGTYKTLQAWFGDIKIFRNNQQVQLDVAPFIIDGTTYVPLRAISNIFNKDVTWDGTNYHIGINDKPDDNQALLLKEYVAAQEKVLELEAKVKNLEAQLASKTPTTLGELEDYLNDEYGTYEKIDFEIDLYGNKDKIEVRMYIDTRYDGSRWNSLSSSKLKSYIKSIVDDVRDSFKNAKISGYIEDLDTDREVATFTVSSGGSVSVSIKSSGSYYGDIEYLEEYLNDKYGRYKDLRVDIELYESKNYIDVYVYVDEYDWDRLSSSNQRVLLEGIYDEIMYDFDDVDVYGEIRDYVTGEELYYFDFDYDGYVYIYY